MTYIYIIEDDPVQAQFFRSIVEKHYASSDDMIEILVISKNFKVPVVSRNAQDLVIFFVDLDLGGKVDGFSFAKMIRREIPMAYIVILTSHIELMAEQFNYFIKTFNYIHKSSNLLAQKIENTLSAIHEDFDNIIAAEILQSKSSETLCFEFKGVHHRINLESVIAIDTDIKLRSTILHTESSEIRSPFRMNEIIKKLPEWFIMSHRSVIINMNKLSKIEMDGNAKVAVMTNGRRFPISKSNYSKVIENFYNMEK